jgi:hypothetical protein
MPITGAEATAGRPTAFVLPERFRRTGTVAYAMGSCVPTAR